MKWNWNQLSSIFSLFRSHFHANSQIYLDSRVWAKFTSTSKDVNADDDNQMMIFLRGECKKISSERTNRDYMSSPQNNGVIIITLHFCARWEKNWKIIVCYTSSNHRCYDTICEYISSDKCEGGVRATTASVIAANRCWIIIPNRLAVESVELYCLNVFFI